MGIGVRVGVELVAAMAVAVAIGWGSRPLAGHHAVDHRAVRPLGRRSGRGERLATDDAARAAEGLNGDTGLATESKIDALGQFELHTSLGPIGRSVNFTQSNLMMVIAGALILMVLYVGMKPRSVVPGRMQSLAEIAYSGIMSMTVGSIGEEGRRFFPFIFTLFFFVLMGNLLGLLPYSFTYTSHIAVTLGLAMMVIVIVTIVALRIHGMHFFSYFFPRRRAQAACAADHPDRGDLLPVASRLTLHPVVREHGRRTRDVRGVRHLRRAPCRSRRAWNGRGHPAHGPQRRPRRVRTARGCLAGLRVRDPDLHLPARRGAPALAPTADLPYHLSTT